MSKTALVKIPKLKVGDDKAVAAMLVKKTEQANEANKVILDAGLLCFYIKENLNHGQFGPWLQAHCPETMWRISQKTQKPIASSTLSWHMGLTKSLVEKCGTTVTKLLSQIPKAWEFGTKGEFLQLPSGSELLLKAPEPVAQMHAKASEIIEGKTAYQLFWEFKQGGDEVDVDQEVSQKPSKRGRRPGEGGATKEQREAAAAREERERLESVQSMADKVTDFLLEYSDVKGFGKLDEIEGGAKTLKKLADAVAYANTFFTALKKASK